ncbi:unnamed protein product [Choristocarpus tenellus]
MAKAIDGFTALHFCAQSGCTEGCQTLLDAGAKVDAKLHKTKKTALHLAASKGHAEVVRLLLLSGADVVAKTTKGETAGDLSSGSDDITAALGAALDRELSRAGATEDSGVNGDSSRERGSGSGRQGEKHETGSANLGVGKSLDVEPAGKRGEDERGSSAQVTVAVMDGTAMDTDRGGATDLASVAGGHAAQNLEQRVQGEESGVRSEPGKGERSMAEEELNVGIGVNGGKAGSEAEIGPAEVVQETGSGGLSKRRIRKRKRIKAAAEVTLAHLQGEDGE